MAATSATVVGRLRKVAERPGDRHAEADVLGGDPDVAGDRHEQAAADRVALEHGDGRLLELVEAADRCVQARLVPEDILAGLEIEELADVGAADERPVAGPAHHQHPDRVVGVNLLAGLAERLVHLPGHRVASLWAIEGQDGDGTIALEDRLVGHGSLRSSEAVEQYGSQASYASTCPLSPDC